MTITEQKAFLQQYTGKAQAPAGFAQAWAETVAALQPEVQLAPVPFANPCGVYEQLTVTYQGRTVTARVIRPAAAGRHPLLLMYHDLNRSVRGWHHMTRFLALGFGTVALEAEPCKGDWQAKPAQADFRTRYLDALAVAKAALALPWVDADCVCTFGEGFGGGLALLAACLLLLSAAMELGYEPICAGVRQRYLFSVAFRMLALAAPLADYFAQYRADGVTSNVVLQCAMIAMLSVHLAMFFALICFNRRQNLLLRVLSGVTGVFPALTASAAVTLAVANLAQPIGLAIAAMLRAAGTVAAFLGDRLTASGALGGIRLKYESVWEGLLLCGGLSLMLIGAWLTASPI